MQTRQKLLSVSSPKNNYNNIAGIILTPEADLPRLNSFSLHLHCGTFHLNDSYLGGYLDLNVNGWLGS